MVAITLRVVIVIVIAVNAFILDCCHCGQVWTSNIIWQWPWSQNAGNDWTSTGACRHCQEYARLNNNTKDKNNKNNNSNNSISNISNISNTTNINDNEDNNKYNDNNNDKKWNTTAVDRESHH